MKKILLFATLLPFILAGCEGMAPENVEDIPAGPSTGTTSELTGTITLYTDNDIIKADDAYTARLTVLLMDKAGVEHDVTSEVDIYCNNDDEPIRDTDFRTSDEGVYEFYAVRGFDISNTVTVRAVDGVAELPLDTDAEATDFRHRIMLLQHTGNECPNCPALMEKLRLLAGDQEYNSLYHHVASHSYNTDDVAYSPAAASLSKQLDVHYYPWLTFNLTTDNAYELDDIKEHVDILHKDAAEVGICAAASMSDNSVYVNVGIKSAVTSKYRVAVWLLEDNIRSTQSGATASWQHLHDNCLRDMAGSTKNECIYGKSLGTVGAGEISEFIAAIDDFDESWNADNCKVIVIVVSATDYELVNCTVCPLDGTVSYEYN